jgi:hypothetical protein
MTESLNSFVEPMRQFVRIKNEIAKAEEALEELKKHRDALADVIITELATAGIDSVPLTVDGQTFNVHMAQPLVVWRNEGVTTEALVDAAKKCDVAWMVKEQVSAQTLQAHVRELLADGGEVPEEMAPLLNIFTKTELRAVKASKAESVSKRAARNLKK